MELPPQSPNPVSSSSSSSSSDVISSFRNQSEPHGALFFVLNYLQLPELLSFQTVCRSLREAIAGDAFLWRRITVEPPLSGKLTDETLSRITSRAEGKLVSLALFDCRRISDAGLLRVVNRNPGITKLYVPGCTNLTGDGVVKMVKRLSEQKSHLECLRISGLRNLTREHFNILMSLLCQRTQYQVPQQSFYGTWHSFPNSDNDRPIDVDICPKCGNVRLVFDCTRENCRTMKHRWSECRGCFFCIARCEECGGCIDSIELGEETACLHLLCLECWLRLPKCNMCNRPYCYGHGSSSVLESADGFICEQCTEPEASSYSLN